MNQDDFDFIEVKLDVVLPDVFTRFMGQFPNCVTHQLECGNAVLPTNAELFAIKQLQQFNGEPVFDCFEYQPELRQRRFMNIGEEGNGDFYCMVGDDSRSDELWAWRHDSDVHPLFVLCTDPTLDARRENLDANPGTTLQSFVDMDWKLAAQPDPFSEMPSSGRIVSRSDHHLRSIFNPITLKDWREGVAQDPRFDLDEYQDLPKIFTGKPMRFCRWPGRAKWIAGDSPLYIHYKYGCLSLETSSSTHLTDEQTVAVRELAERLNANEF